MWFFVTKAQYEDALDVIDKLSRQNIKLMDQNRGLVASALRSYDQAVALSHKLAQLKKGSLQ